MLFTATEMETVCIFHAGTRPATLEVLRKMTPDIKFPDRKLVAESAIKKLEEMSDEDFVALEFDPEE